MSEFYGRVQGNRGEATRGGSKDSGIRATVESWASVVRTRMFCTPSESGFYIGSGHTSTVEVTDKHGNSTGFRFSLDTDALARFRNNEDVQKQVEKVKEAVEGLGQTLEGVAIFADAAEGKK